MGKGLGEGAHPAAEPGLHGSAVDGYVAPMLSGAHASGDVEVVVHLEGLIDPAKETERMNRETVSTTAPSP